MTVSLEEFKDLWCIACQDAGYVPGEDAALYPVPGSSSEKGASALYLTPGTFVRFEPEWPLSDGQVADINSPAKRDLHRILARDFVTPRVALGRLRHELQHARQYEDDPETYEAIAYAQDALAWAFQESQPPTRCGSAALYNLLPSEEDANRASARLTAVHFGPPSVIELESTDAPLFRDESAPDTRTLAARLLALMALFPDGVAKVAEERNEAVTQLVACLGQKAAGAWGRLEAHPELADLGRDALVHCPTEAEVAAADRPPLAWAPVVEGIRVGKAAAEGVLREDLPELHLN